VEVVLGLAFCGVALSCIGLVVGLISLMLAPGVGELGYSGAKSILVSGDSGGDDMASRVCGSA
jgi:hypothetical protein